MPLHTIRRNHGEPAEFPNRNVLGLLEAQDIGIEGQIVRKLAPAVPKPLTPIQERLTAPMDARRITGRPRETILRQNPAPTRRKPLTSVKRHFTLKV
jgi:hypothetical protein